MPTSPAPTGPERGPNEAIWSELEAAWGRGGVHGAYLLEGPPGTGKRATAVAFAALLLRGDRSAPVTALDDGAIASRHPDLHVVAPDGTFIRIDQVRGLQRDLSLAPNEGGRRIGLLLEAERLRTEAANALLKTLEEPPRDATLILVTTVAERLPPTVRSRTTRLRFARESEATVRRALEDEGHDSADAGLAAALGGGSTEAARQWAEEHLEAAREMREVIESASGAAAGTLLDFAERFRGAASRGRAELFFDVHAAIGRNAVERATEARDPALARAWLERIEAGERARSETTRRNLNAQLVVETLLLDLRRAALR